MGKHSIPEPAKRCIGCNDELRRVFDDHDTDQYDNALEITLGGGYGMFFDDLDAGCVRHVFLCHDCSHSACDALPWLDSLISPLKSHSHREDYWEANPDHEGWDKRYWEGAK